MVVLQLHDKQTIPPDELAPESTLIGTGESAGGAIGVAPPW
jgi:hypothetical protein